MKDEFYDEPELRKILDRYEPEIPRKQLLQKHTKFDRFIRYLFSPAENPLEKLPESRRLLTSYQVLPLGLAAFLTVIQTIYYFIQ